ncbi:MAG: aminoglycoside phosphotransferase family protein [Kiritimatiellae bacterium]|nr:aminoglycoside phosphotransferase family protein [Kiritimatiellia bacterium]
MSNRNFTEEQLREIIALFQVYGDIVSVNRYGSGHINDTFKIDLSIGGAPVSYVLQRINDSIFTRPDRVMENIARVTNHIRGKFARAEDATRRTLTVIPARDGQPVARGPEGGWWRMYVFITGAKTIDLIENADQARKAAKAFAGFQNALADLPAPRLFETIPNFHNTLSRLEQLDTAAAEDKMGRKASVAAELAFVDAHREEAGKIVKMMENGEIPERITHNDTKINNVMLDDETGEGVAVIDLDTVMPGCALYDFGDMVRTSTAAAAEDEKDLSKVFSRKEYFEALVKGYLSEAKFLTDAEKENLAFSGRLITFTIGIRFLADYLAGDTYFRTAYADHNLVRCRTQFKMVESMEAQKDEYEAIVRAN